MIPHSYIIRGTIFYPKKFCWMKRPIDYRIEIYDNTLYISMDNFLFENFFLGGMRVHNRDS